MQYVAALITTTYALAKEHSGGPETLPTASALYNHGSRAEFIGTDEMEIVITWPGPYLTTLRRQLRMLHIVH